MPLSHYDSEDYIPVIAIRQSETKALLELPESDKVKFTPILVLRKWANSHSFERTLDRIDKVYPERHFICDLADEIGEQDLPVNDTIRELLDSEGRYRNWRNFIMDNERMIPVVRSPMNVTARAIRAQVDHFCELGRGMMVRLGLDRHDALNIYSAISESNVDSDEIIIALDAGILGVDLNFVALGFINACILAYDTIGLEKLKVLVLSTSFPNNFTDLGQRSARINIRERMLYDSLCSSDEIRGRNIELIYGDYASVNPTKLPPGPKNIPARIDWASKTYWVYQRRTGDKESGYIEAADALKSEPEWDEELDLWSTKTISRAASGDTEKLLYPGVWTAVRINLHLHQQINFRSDAGVFYDTDDEWQD